MGNDSMRILASWFLAAAMLVPGGAYAQDAPSAELAVQEATVAAEPVKPREPSLQDRLEAVETAKLNREAAEFAARQVAENEAARSKGEADRIAYEEALALRRREAIETQSAQAARDAEFERDLAEQRRREVEYQASVARHNRCSAGSWQACDDIKKAKPLSTDQLTAAAATLTDTDARACVAQPVASPDEAFEGSTRATIVNTCDKPVDVRICLRRATGWNCGLAYAVKPQEQGSHWSFETQGEPFWDARLSGSTRPLASPN